MTTRTQAHTRPLPALPFDAVLSRKLDRLIISLDTVPPWNRRAWLRFKNAFQETAG